MWQRCLPSSGTEDADAAEHALEKSRSTCSGSDAKFGGAACAACRLDALAATAVACAAAAPPAKALTAAAPPPPNTGSASDDTGSAAATCAVGGAEAAEVEAAEAADGRAGRKLAWKAEAEAAAGGRDIGGGGGCCASDSGCWNCGGGASAAAGGLRPWPPAAPAWAAPAALLPLPGSMLFRRPFICGPQAPCSGEPAVHI